MARPDVASVEIEGERVLYDPVNDGVSLLDRMASVIWPFLDGTATVAELAGDLADVFEVDRDSVAEDLTTLLGQLDDAGLLAHSDEPRVPPSQDDGAAERPRHLVDPPAG